MYAIDKKSINYIKKYLISNNIKTKQGKYFCVSTITSIKYMSNRKFNDFEVKTTYNFRNLLKRI